MNELYKRWRPKRLEDIVGQDGAVRSIQKLLQAKKFPHAIMLTGPSGTGKTTIARIFRRTLNCGRGDYEEIDCAMAASPLETIREIHKNMHLCPMSGDCRIFFLEEAQALSRAGFSQQALLKILEDTPSHVYFFLATTDPGKLIPAIHTRCSQIKLQSIKPDVMKRLLLGVLKAEKMKVSEDVLDEVCEAAEGSARKALVILEQIAGLATEKEQIDGIQSTTFNKDQAITLARALIFKPSWSDVAPILRNLSEQEPEGIRYAVLGYARAILIGSKDGKPPNPRFMPNAYKVIDIFSGNFYDSKQAGLAAACYEVVMTK